MSSILILGGFVIMRGSAAVALQPSHQGRVIDVDATPCRGCSVTVRRALVIGGADTRLMGAPALVARDSRGRIFVLDQRARDEPPHVYDSTGAFIGPLGGKGKGPGEVTPTSFVEIARGDTIRVHSQGRISIFAPNLVFIKSFIQRTPETAPWDLVPLAGGGSASTSRIVARASDMTPVTIRDANGLRVRTIELSDNKGIQPIRRLAVARPQWQATLWVSETHQLKTEYRVMLMDTLGNVHVTLRREPEWWYAKKAINPMRFIGVGDTMARPVTSITSIREDARGRLLVLMSHGRLGWKAVRHLDRYDGHYEARLDVMDIATRRLVGSVTVPGAPFQILSDDRFATYREDADGNPWLEVWLVSAKP